jgi:hypothetical protein
VLIFQKIFPANVSVVSTILEYYGGAAMLRCEDEGEKSGAPAIIWLDFSCVLAHRLIRHDKTLGLADAFAGIATLWTDQR